MKKIVRILMLTLLVVVVTLSVALFSISVQFNKLPFIDEFLFSEDYTHYYPESYHAAKDAFRYRADVLSTQFENVEASLLQVPSERDEDLSVDFLYVPSQDDGDNLLILVSGVHGIEGFVGHAVQLMFMDRFMDSDLLAQTGVLFIHGVSPYGMKNIRRVTENNVDLNRNSPTTPFLYNTVNEGYTEIYDFINPAEKVNRFSLQNRFFFLTAFNEIRKASMPVLRQAVLQGQYEYPEGLYFGGFKPEPQIEALIPLVKAWCTPYNKILAIDLHTGYGERGRLHLFPNPMEGKKRQVVEYLFDGYSIDWGDSDDFYTITGEFNGLLAGINEGKDFYSMPFEYGTLNSQTTIGSLQSIHIMILENQGRHHGYASEKDSLRVINDFREMYYPSSIAWRNHIMEQTVDMFKVVLPRFVNL